jgi:hypothetical protein
MRHSRKGLLSLLVLALFAAPVLSGCGSSGEPTVAAAVADSGILGSLGEQLKREDDQAEVNELRESAPQTREEVEEDHERSEEAAIQAGQVGAGETEQLQEGESGQPTEGESEAEGGHAGEAGQSGEGGSGQAQEGAGGLSAEAVNGQSLEGAGGRSQEATGG